MLDEDPFTNLGGMVGLLDPSGKMVPIALPTASIFTGGSSFSSGSISFMGVDPKFYVMDSAACAIEDRPPIEYLKVRKSPQEIEFEKSLEFYDSLCE